MISSDPFETTHADNIRKADAILTNVLQNIQKAKYPGLTDEVVALKVQQSLQANKKMQLKLLCKASDLLKK
jgi:hypothetical protein